MQYDEQNEWIQPEKADWSETLSSVEIPAEETAQASDADGGEENE